MPLRVHTTLSIYRFLFLLSASLIQFGCANESIPQGGKQDQAPPTITKAIPADKSIHFQSNKIQLTFNEFLKASAFSQTLISPPLDKRPDIKVSGKTLTIKLKSPLRANTTYTINFADDIKDLNEGNTANNLTYVFSTGDYIDSLQVAGNVFLAKDNTAAEGAIVSLYPADSGDAILESKPFYFAKTDKAGHFEINNIKSARYNIYGLKDQNYNYLFDQPNEMIAFGDSVINLSGTGSSNINLYLFDDNHGKIKLNEVRSIAPGFLKISYTKPINSFKLNGELYSADDFARFYDTNDTINYWYTKSYIKKTELYLAANDTLFDTARMELKFIPMDSLFSNANYALSIVNQANAGRNAASSIEIWNTEDLYKPLKIIFSRPVAYINESKSLHIADSSGESSNPRFTLDEKTKQFILVEFEKKENAVYSLEIPDSMFRDILSTWNKEIQYKFRTSGKDAYGNMRITLKTDHPAKYYIVRLLNANNEVLKEFLFTGNGERKVSVENILAGSYKFLVIEDDNRNGKWDTGDFKNKVQPEKMFVYKDTYQLKGGWDLEAVVKF
jgi:hypothetical protein